MAATTQVQILVRTDGSAKALRATRVGPRPGVGSGAAVRSCLRSRVARLAFVAPPHVHAPPPQRAGQHRAASTELGSCSFCRTSFFLSPHRLVVRTSRCGRDNPGSNPGVDKGCTDTLCGVVPSSRGLAGAVRWCSRSARPSGQVAAPRPRRPGLESWRALRLCAGTWFGRVSGSSVWEQQPGRRRASAP